VLAVLRLVGLALAVALAGTVLAWTFTGERLRLAWRIFKYGVYVLAVVLLLFAGEALFHTG
jgi:predicted membrane channel-forming protein YqfA (hemolysin III family)